MGKAHRFHPHRGFAGPKKAKKKVQFATGGGNGTIS